MTDMSETEAQWQSHLYGILPHPTEARVLLLAGEAGWTLPYMHVAREVWSAEVGCINEGLGRTMKAQLTTLRYANFCSDEARRQVEAVYLLENHDPAWAPPSNGQWVGGDELARLPLARPEHRAMIEQYLAENDPDTRPARRPPWAQKGWFVRAEAWMQTQLAQSGYTVTAPIEQVKSWCISCILRARTTAGDVYFKQAAALPLFGPEPRLTAGLARLYPDHIPIPLAIDEEQGWMLLADFGPEVGWDAPLAVREEALALFGQLQINFAGRVDELFALGCLDRRLDRLAEQIEPLLYDGHVRSALNVAEVEKLQALAPQLKTMCAALASYKVPQTLVHGDLHLSNVARQGGKYLFFDWTDACVTHPFLDMIDILREKDESAQARLRDRYLALWSDYEPPERLQEMWVMAEPLCALHQAVSYQYIMANVEPVTRQDLAWPFSHFLRKILQSIEKM